MTKSKNLIFVYLNLRYLINYADTLYRYADSSVKVDIIDSVGENKEVRTDRSTCDTLLANEINR